MRIAICDVHAYTRLKKAYEENNNFAAKHLENEMSKYYMVPPEIALEVINCIAVFVGFKSSAAAVLELTTEPTTEQNPVISPNNMKPKPVKRPVIKVPSPAIIAAKKFLLQDYYVPVTDTIDYTSQSIDFNLKIGGTIRFGRFDWLVLEIQGKKALIISDKIIETRWYHDRSTGTNWAGCSLRRYLNGAFYNTFSLDEKSRITKSAVKTSRNPWFGTDGGGDTKDNIFLLSISDVVKFFGDSKKLKKRPKHAGHIDDRYNKARMAKNIKGSADWWWLRSPGYSLNRAVFVSAAGSLYIYGGLVCGNSGAGGGIRPAMWLNI